MVDSLSLAIKELGSMPDPGIPTFIETPGGSYWQKAMGENVEFKGWRGI